VNGSVTAGDVAQKTHGFEFSNGPSGVVDVLVQGNAMCLLRTIYMKCRFSHTSIRFEYLVLPYQVGKTDDWALQ
jgi:hypothetical protein